jgi:hypothetical protein
MSAGERRKMKLPTGAHLCREMLRRLNTSMTFERHAHELSGVLTLERFNLQRTVSFRGPTRRSDKAIFRRHRATLDTLAYEVDPIANDIGMSR